MNKRIKTLTAMLMLASGICSYAQDGFRPWNDHHVNGINRLPARAEQIDTTRMKSPAFKMILTATGGYAYRRPEDGIYVIPIGCLKP